MQFKNDEWVNAVNPDLPFEQPNFDRAVYVFFNDEVSAMKAFENREIDAVLTPRGLSSDVKGIEYRPTTSARFIVFNTAHVYLSDPVLRMALGCVIDRSELTSNMLGGKAFELDRFALGMWKIGSADVCGGLDESERISRATQLLKARGYAWEQEPGSDTEGRGLLIPSSGLLPEVTLLVPPRDEDPDKYQAGVYFLEQARKLGLTVLLKETDAVYLTYKVFSSREYDLALVGWRLGAYPAHLCAWFGSGGQFDYGNASIHSNCDALNVEPNLEAALNFSSEIQASLANDAPFIPLYLDGVGEAIRGVQYPFQGTFGDWYGSPSLAAPK
jgi:ABC-type transport system substrate-binding protein